jgi:glycosyltransferase involved in cell wall biosynthesis
MKVNFNTVTIGPNTGYGNASRLLTDALRKQDVIFSEDASVVLNFTMPDKYRYNWRGVNIGYTPWESTSVPTEWFAGLRAVDYLWAPSVWNAQVLGQNSGREVFVLPHGIASAYFSQKRSLRYPFTFIYVGDPAIRKGGNYVLEAWHKRYGRDNSVRLIYKCQKYPLARVKDASGSIVSSPASYSNVTIVGKNLNTEEMVGLYHSAHCMIYPSRGEGFGLIPLEAMATGMPAIFPAETGMADFAEYGYPLYDFDWEHSSDQIIHPGNWLKLNVDELISQMEYVVENYDKVAEDSYLASQVIHKKFDWDTVAVKAIHQIESYLSP